MLLTIENNEMFSKYIFFEGSYILKYVQRKNWVNFFAEKVTIIFIMVNILKSQGTEWVLHLILIRSYSTNKYFFVKSCNILIEYSQVIIYSFGEVVK